MDPIWEWKIKEYIDKIEMTVALPAYNAIDIIWLALESLKNQSNINFKWELICLEEYGKSRNIIKTYANQLPNCVRIVHRCIDPIKECRKEQDKFIGKFLLIDKWIQIAWMSSNNSKIFVLHAIDDYSPPKRLYIHHEHFKNNQCILSQQKKGIFYNICTAQIILFDGNLKDKIGGGILNHLNLAFKINDIKKIIPINKNNAIDTYLRTSVETINKISFDNNKEFILIDESLDMENWKYGFFTDGKNTISKSRINVYDNINLKLENSPWIYLNEEQKKELNYFNLNTYIPKYILDKLESLKLNLNKSIKIVSIVGTRPQYIKLANLSKEFDKYKQIQHIVINTGQHYDNSMSHNIMKILEMKVPNYNLNINNSDYNLSISNMINKIKKLLENEKPNLVIVYGDCDTTLAGALAAKKLNIKLMHIEAGLRSFNRNMPEEINRILVDNISDILCCPMMDALENLKKESNENKIFITGNLQIDLLKTSIVKFKDLSVLEKNNLKKNCYILITIHRNYNTNKNSLSKLFFELEKIKDKIIFPVHPRTKKIIIDNNLIIPKNIIIHDPFDYQEMNILERFSKLILTDSGGVQVEAFYLSKKCLILRTETEWSDIIKSNYCKLCKIDDDLFNQIKNLLNEKIKDKLNSKLVNAIDCAKEIVEIILNEI